MDIVVKALEEEVRLFDWEFEWMFYLKNRLARRSNSWISIEIIRKQRIWNRRRSRFCISSWTNESLVIRTLFITSRIVKISNLCYRNVRIEEKRRRKKTEFLKFNLVLVTDRISKSALIINISEQQLKNGYPLLETKFFIESNDPLNERN